MAIIPAEEKVFMVSNGTNTTYGGSTALQAMNQWYTMQDVIDSVSAGESPTLQQVTEAGNTTDQPIYVDVGGDVALQGVSYNNYGVYGSSEISVGVNGVSVSAFGVYGSSIEDSGVYGSSTYGSGVYGASWVGYGVYGTSTDSPGGFFTSNSSYSLVANESAAKPGGGSWSVYSDSRIKENVVPYTKGLADILLINTVTYEYNGLAGTTKGAKFTGIIAQEIKEIFPETVNTYKAKLNEEDKEKTELYDFNSSDLTFALINAVKELFEKIKILEAK